MAVTQAGQSDVGVIGLGTMGAMLSLNIAEHGFDVSVFNRTNAKTRAFVAEAGELAHRILGADALENFVNSLKTPRLILLMVPAGEVVDQQIASLAPLLDPQDVIIDAGNANFRDTDRRTATASDYRFMGIGVSGGEEGARFGPAIMAGGPRDCWDVAAHILTSISAKYEGEPCANWFGPGGAGHFVKMVHNGIEYADMQLIAEVYGLMRDGLGFEASDIASVFDRWNSGPLESYLIEISARVAEQADPESGLPMLDVILDKAGQKGTGRWTVIEAQHLGAAIPVIEAAVAARNMSSDLDKRRAGETLFGPAPQPLPAGRLTIDDLEAALIAGKIICYAQGFALLDRASTDFGWGLPLDVVARTWRAGCIIRSAMLNDMAAALSGSTESSLIHAPFFAEQIRATESGLRKVATEAMRRGHAVPAMSSALAWFDTMRTERGTANMVQAQRDFFGAHGFERTDKAGTDYHGPWARFWE